MGKIWLLLLLAVNFTIAWAAEAQITATGSGATQRDALMDAQRKAVEQGVGVLVDSQTLSRNMMLVGDKIFSKARGYVKHYTVISQERQDDGNWKVMIECEVADEKIKASLKTLGILRDKMGNPRITVLYDPEITGGIYRQHHPVVSEAYEGIVEYLAEREFPVLTSLKDPGKTTIQRGPREKAEYILVYNIKRGNQESTDIFKKGWVMISAKIISTSSGQVLAGQNKKVMGVDTDSIDFAFRKAGRKAGKLAAKFLEDKLVAKWGGETVSGRVVILELLNVNNFKLLVDFNDELRRTHGVQNILNRDSISNTVEYEITYVGDIDTLLGNVYTILEKMGLEAKVPISHGDWICIELIDNPLKRVIRSLK
jgi:hypothetical protein